MSRPTDAPPGVMRHAWRIGALDDLRDEIDRIDRSLLELLTERYRTAEEVGRLKARLGVLSLDPAREAHVVRRAAEEGRARGVPEEGVREVFWAVIALCRRGVLS